MLEQPVRFEKRDGGARHPLSPNRVHGNRRAYGLGAAPRFHFDEDYSSAVHGDDVDLAIPKSTAGDDNPVTLTPKKTNSCDFAPLAKGEGAQALGNPILDRHGRCSNKDRGHVPT